MRRGSLVQLVLLAAGFAVAATAVAMFVPWLPESASEERGRIDFVFWFTTAICIGIFSVVAAVTVYSVLKFRAQPDDDSDGAPIHGHTGLEIAWTAVPAVLVTAIAIVSAVVLAKNGETAPNQMQVEVTARQFAWSFKYASEGDITSSVLRLPLDRPVELKLTALDVIHSFWVPQFGQKQDAPPGTETRLEITPNKLGSFPVVCTELCGLGHPFMRSRAIVMPPAEFDKWVTDQRRAVGGGGTGAGRSVFTSNGCGSCHTFKPAGAAGKVGPDLDKLPDEARRAGKPLEAFIRESIVEPNAYVEPSFGKGIMPSFRQLPKEQLDALVQYLAGGGKTGTS